MNLQKILDILVFQETHFINSFDTTFFEQVFGSNFFIFHSFGPEKFSGTCVFFNKKVFEENLNISFEIPGRCMAIIMNINGFSMLFTGIYAPAQADPREKIFQNLFKKIQLSANSTDFSEMIIVCDFNFVEDQQLIGFLKRKIQCIVNVALKSS